MADKPSTAAGYRSEALPLVRATCLYLATKLGDLQEEVVVIGGLVPSLLVEPVTGEIEAHAGTMDLDLGLTTTLLGQGQYREISERLRRAGFVQDISETGKLTRQRWKIEGSAKVTVDFLIPPSSPDEPGAKLRHLEPDFAAIVAPGLHLAFRDRRWVVISGETIFGEGATRGVWVCGPGAFVILKALAFDLRGENKDAYDLSYIVRNFGSGVGDVAAAMRPLLGDREAVKALEILRRDFLSHQAVGPRRVAAFKTGKLDDAIQADVVGFVGNLLRSLDSER